MSKSRGNFLDPNDFVAAFGQDGARYVALRDGVFAGGADFRITDDIAQLAGAATTPAHRRHGVQTALLAARLLDARAAGCDIAVIVTQPGSKSQQNAQRRGFHLLYSQATLFHIQDAVADDGHHVAILQATQAEPHGRPR